MKDYNNPILPPDLDDSSSFDDKSSSGIIKVIGVGGGGGNAVNYMYQQRIPFVDFVLCNTDKQALDCSPVERKLVLGYDITGGRGAGNKPDVGRMCAESSRQDILALFDDNTEMVFITAGMGGGTGTGAAPVIASIAKELGKLTIGIVTVPFFFEGERKILKALEGANEMKKHVDALLVINNENLIELYKDLNIFNAFEKADDTLANAARSISDIIADNLYINVDFEDVKTTLKDSGTAIIATAYGEGEHRVAQAIRGALHSPLLKAHDLKTSKRLLLKVLCSKESERPINMDELNQIREFTDTLPESIDVKWGIGDDPTLGEKVKMTVLASGFDVTLGNTKHPTQEGGKPEEKRIVLTADAKEEKPVVQRSQRETKDIIAEVYGTEKLTKQKIDSLKSKYVVLQPSELDDHDIVDLLDRVPALNREQWFTAELRAIRQRTAAVNTPSPRNSQDQNRPGRSSEVISFG